MSSLRELYRTVTPPNVRRVIRKVRRTVPPALHWYLKTPTQRHRWVESRLQLENHYWLFILGCNNSGTTMLNTILSSHPEMRTLVAEGQYTSGALPLPEDHGVRRLWSARPDLFRWTEDDDPTPALRARHDWALRYPARPGILVEKSPPNTMRSRWLQRNFRPCRFLAIVRSPYAVCEGIRRREHFTIEEAAQHWATANRILFEDAPHLERFMWFRYEDLCARPEEHLQRFEGFLELRQPFDRAVLERIDVHNMLDTPSALQDFNKKSLARLSRQDIDTINRVAGARMEQLGYPQE